jgi:transcriptional regulator with XRE-family HTH domain
MTGRIFADPSFGIVLKELREERRLSLRRLGQRVHCSHGYLWDLESGNKNPSVALASQLDAVLEAGGRLSSLVWEDSPSGRNRGAYHPQQNPHWPGLEFVSDRLRGIDVVIGVWAGDLQRGQLNRDLRFDATAFLAPAMRWLISPLDERPSGAGERLVGAPDVDTVRQITTVYRALDNQYGGGHIRKSRVRFLHHEVAGLLRGRYDARTGAALLSTAAEATQLAAWATYDVRRGNERACAAVHDSGSSTFRGRG